VSARIFAQGLLCPRDPKGDVIPGWQLAAAWLLAVAVASVIYFVPVTRLVDTLIPDGGGYRSARL
jgi:hypothetical protein